MGNHFRTVFPFYSPAGSTLPGNPPQPLLAGWLLEAKATTLPEQLFLQPTRLETPQVLTGGLQVVVAF